MSVSLHIMSCGWITLPTAFLVQGGEGTIEIPVPSFLIRHPSGTAVFDTGLELGLGIQAPAPPPRQRLDDDLRRVGAAAVLAVGDDIAARLRSADVDPDRVDYIVNSHLHFDHCGGNALLPNARMVVQKREWAAGCIPECHEKHHYYPHDFNLGHDRIEVEGEYDLFGDGSVVCVPSFGHTPGHQSLRVRLDDGEVMLTVDACILRASLEKMALPTQELIGDAEQMLQHIRAFAQMQTDGIGLIFGHDREQFDRLSDGSIRPVTAQAVAAARSANA